MIKKIGIGLLSLSLLIVPVISFAAQPENVDITQESTIETSINSTDENQDANEPDTANDEDESLQEKSTNEDIADDTYSGPQGTALLTVSGTIADNTIPSSDTMTMTLYNIGTSDIYTAKLTRDAKYIATVEIPYGQYSIKVVPEMDFDTITCESNTFEIMKDQITVNVNIEGVTEEEYKMIQENNTTVVSENQNAEIQTEEEQPVKSHSWLANNFLTLVIIAGLGIALFIIKKKKNDALGE